MKIPTAVLTFASGAMFAFFLDQPLTSKVYLSQYVTLALAGWFVLIAVFVNSGKTTDTPKASARNNPDIRMGTVWKNKALDGEFIITSHDRLYGTVTAYSLMAWPEIKVQFGSEEFLEIFEKSGNKVFSHVANFYSNKKPL